MLNVPERIKGVTHPLVSSIYLKKDCGDSTRPEDVLIINTNFEEAGEDYESFDSYLMALLDDLHELRAQAEKSVGSFDRIDIRT
ncbi:MAG: hypothetical protein IT558_05395 [Alphaproteobacteria bacterium]|nr:hypothetical protein [Alphaproteobacteria bacterium]